MAGWGRQGLAAGWAASAPCAAWQSLWSWRDAPALAGGWPQSPATSDFCLHPCQPQAHGKPSWELWGQEHARPLPGRWTQQHPFPGGGCSGVPHHLAGSLPGGEILCPSQCCLDMIPELLLPCSKPFNNPAGGWQWLLTQCWVLSCSWLARVTPQGPWAGECPGGLRAWEPLTELGSSLLFRSKLHIKAKCRCCWAPPRRAASFS